VPGGAPSPERIAQRRGFGSRWPRQTGPHHKCAGLAGDDKISRNLGCKTLVPDRWARCVRTLALDTILSTRPQAEGVRDAEGRCRVRDQWDRKMDKPNAILLETDGMIVLIKQTRRTSTFLRTHRGLIRPCMMPATEYRPSVCLTSDLVRQR
jgi:hypothetical protein